ncbi:MAG: peptidylprolyl isomerase, partial [Gemmatimonadales bacterium]
CSHLRDVFSAHADTAAEAGGLTLRASRLAEVITHAKGLKPNQESAELVANLWIDYALLGQTVASRQVLTDSVTVAEVMWPEIAERIGTTWHDTLLGRRDRPTGASADSVYQGNQVRVLQHILFRVPAKGGPDQKAAAKKQALGALGRIKAGADFGTVAEQISEDPGSKPNRGYLPPSRRGQFAVAFDSAAWILAPGAMSGVVETPFGMHLIRRPPMDQAREHLVDWLTQVAGARLDSLYLDSLAIRHRLTVLRSAPATIRAALLDRDAATKSPKTLVRYTGGELNVAQFMRWVLALPPQYFEQLQAAGDTTVADFTKIIAQNSLLLHEADSAGIRLSGEEWKEVEQSYLGKLDTLRTGLGFDDPELTDSTVSLNDRNKVAGLKLEQYFDQVIGGRTRPRPLPGLLSALLRSQGSYHLRQAGLTTAIDLGTKQGPADSSKTPPRPGIRPAAGPAPIPGGGASVPDTAHKTTLPPAAGAPARP